METPHLFVSARSDRELGVFLRDRVARNEVLLEFHRCSPFQRDLRAFPVDHGEFVRTPTDIHCLIQHRCVPSAFVDWGNLALRALRDLGEREEVTLNYQTIYETIANPFRCKCGDRECYGEVRGFRHLTFDQKLKLELYLSPYLKRLLNEEAVKSQFVAS